MQRYCKTVYKESRTQTGQKIVVPEKVCQMFPINNPSSSAVSKTSTATTVINKAQVNSKQPIVTSKNKIIPAVPPKTSNTTAKNNSVNAVKNLTWVTKSETSSISKVSTPKSSLPTQKQGASKVLKPGMKVIYIKVKKNKSK